MYISFCVIVTVFYEEFMIRVIQINVRYLAINMFTLLFFRGYAFLCYLTPEHATNAIKELNGHEIRPGVQIAVSKSEGNKRLYMGNIHKEKSQEELLAELQILFTGVKGVFVQQDANEPAHNRGLLFSKNVLHSTVLSVSLQSDFLDRCNSAKKQW